MQRIRALREAAFLLRKNVQKGALPPKIPGRNLRPLVLKQSLRRECGPALLRPSAEAAVRPFVY